MQNAVLTHYRSFLFVQFFLFFPFETINLNGILVTLLVFAAPINSPPGMALEAREVLASISNLSTQATLID